MASEARTGPRRGEDGVRAGARRCRGRLCTLSTSSREAESDSGRRAARRRLQAAQAQRQQLGVAQGDGHLGELGLGELEGGDGTTELLALAGMLQRTCQAVARGAGDAPHDPVAGLGEAREGAAQAAGAGQQRVLAEPDAVEAQLGLQRGAQGQLVGDVLGREARGPPLDEEAAHAVLGACAQTTATSAMEPMPIQRLTPSRTQPSPSRRAVVSMLDGSRPGARLGQPEAADRLAAGHLRQPSLLLLLGAEGVDRLHRQRALHGHERAQPAVDGLELGAGEPVLDRAAARAAVALQVHRRARPGRRARGPATGPTPHARTARRSAARRARPPTTRPARVPRAPRGRGRRPGRGGRAGSAHSHSIVPGGFDVMSRVTRLTSRSSLIMRDAICSSRS